MYYVFEQLTIDRYNLSVDYKNLENFQIAQQELINKFVRAKAFIDDNPVIESVDYTAEDGAKVNSYRLGNFKNLKFIKYFVHLSSRSNRDIKSQFVNNNKFTGQTNILDHLGNIVEQTSNCQTGVCARFDDGHCREYGAGGCHDIAGFDPKKLTGPKQHHIPLVDFRQLLKK